MSLSSQPPLDTTRFIARHVAGLRRSGIRDFFELVAKNPLASVERILEAHELSLEAGELLRREKGLGKKALQAAGAGDHFAVLGRKLFEAEHGNDVFKFGVLRQRAPDFLCQGVVPCADDTRRGHLGTGLQRVDRRVQAFARPLAREHD